MSKKQLERWENGDKLSRAQSMAANCYLCNGYSNEILNDCLGFKTCPLYPWSPWGKKTRPVNPRRSQAMLKRISKRK